MNETASPFWRSKKFLASLVGMLIPVLNSLLSLNISEEATLQIVMVLVTYVSGETLLDYRAMRRSERDLEIKSKMDK